MDSKKIKYRAYASIIALIAISAFVGGITVLLLNSETESTGVTSRAVEKYEPKTTTEEKIIDISQNSIDSVVGIIALKDLPTYEECFTSQFFGFSFPSQCPTGATEKQEIGFGSGFVVAPNIILTNKHVIDDETAEYVVLTHNNERFTAEVITRDPVEDLALLRVDGLNLDTVVLGDSDSIIVGQIVIAVGNALGRFDNSLSLGIVSGLQRTIVAGNTVGEVDTLREIIQTDAAINPGNSGGPLFNLSGEVIGVNVAYASQANSISFSIPIDRAKNSIQQAVETGKVEYPFLGISYVPINPETKQEHSISEDQGVYIIDPRGQDPIVEGSSAEKAGIQDGDIITHIDDIQINENNNFGLIIRDYRVGDTISIRIIRNEEEITLQATLQPRPDDL